MAIKSDNVIVRIIIIWVFQGFSLLWGETLRLIQSRFNIEGKYVLKVWSRICNNESDPD